MSYDFDGRGSSWHDFRRRPLLFAVGALLLLALVGLAAAMLHSGGAVSTATSATTSTTATATPETTTTAPSTSTNTGPTPVPPSARINPKAASWNAPWHAGNPQATRYGEAFQVLNHAHAPAHARSVYWLGAKFDHLFPYVRAMSGDGADAMLSTVVYADRRSVDIPHLILTAWDASPLAHGVGSQGSALAATFRGLPVRHDGGRAWTDASNAKAGSSEALVQIGPHTLLQVVRLDNTVPALAAIVGALRPY